MQTLYAIGDVHGQKAAQDHALRLIESDGGPAANVIFLGDYTDRGPDSRTVIDTLIDGFETKNWRGVRGNHDRMFCDFVEKATTTDDHIKSGITWLNARMGGLTTLRSYFDIPDDADHEFLGKDPALAAKTQALSDAAKTHVPEAHLSFLSSLPLMIEMPGLIFVHAGINPKLPLDQQDEEDLLWIRTGWLDHTDPLQSLVVHGHTALETPQHHGNRVNLDGGAGYGRPLVPAVIETDGQTHRFFTLSEAGRTELTPQS